MSRRTKIIIGVAIALLLAILLGLFLWLRQPAELQVVDVGTQTDTTPTTGLPGGTTTAPVGSTPTTTPTETPTETPAAPPDERNNLRRLSSAFAERLGSFSNQSDFGNVLDLKVFMTSTMAAWADRYVADQRAKQGDTTLYFGTTTRAISTEVEAYDEGAGTARIIVKTQRNETKSDGSSRVYYQDLQVDYLRQGSTWKIDAAYWK